MGSSLWQGPEDCPTPKMLDHDGTLKGRQGWGSPIPTLGVPRRSPKAFPIREQTWLFLIPSGEQKHPSC